MSRIGLIKVEDGVGTTIAQYYYDPFGRRLLKIAVESDLLSLF